MNGRRAVHHFSAGRGRPEFVDGRGRPSHHVPSKLEGRAPSPVCRACGLRLGLLACAALLFGGGAGASVAAAESDDAAVEQGREALGSQRRFPWYDGSNDGVRRVRVSVPLKSPQGKRKPAGGGAWNFSWLELAAWTVVLALFAGLAYLLIRAYLDREDHATSMPAAATARAALDDAMRIEALPFRVRSGPLGLLDEARRHYEQGDFRQAIVYLFSYQLVEMDKQQIIRLAKGKTNRQYLRETRRRPSLQSLVAQTMVAFEDVFFGDHPLDRTRFESCWLRLGEFDTLVAQPGAV